MTTKCPSCFNELLSDATWFRCTGQCAEEKDDRATVYRGHDIVARPVFAIRHAPAAVVEHGGCPACSTVSRRHVCGLCHADLPPGWRSTTTTCVALAGARYSGKSVFIGVLVRQLRALLAQSNSVLTALSAETEQLYTARYEQALFTERQIPVATPPQRRGDAQYAHAASLVYVLTPPGHPRHVLVIRDVAGEDLQKPEIDEYLFSFFAHADGVVFMVDPMQVRTISQQLAGRLDWQGAHTDDPLKVLANLARLRARIPGARPVPLALTLAKFDALHALEDVEGSPLQPAMRNHGASYLRDPSMDSWHYDEADGDLLDVELQSLITSINGANLLNYARNAFPIVRCFAVSALGHHPDATRLGRSGITPFRCLDPVKWIMSRPAA